MFWKKNKPKTESIKAEDQRETFRYVFRGGRQLSMTFLHKTVEVVNISAGGMAFKNNGFQPYESDQITLFLDIPNFRGEPCFSARLRILNITENNICNCIYENCTVQDYEMIHKYVLELQKKDLATRSKYQTK